MSVPKHVDLQKIWGEASKKIKPELTCPHCEKIDTSEKRMARFHFDNCKTLRTMK